MTTTSRGLIHVRTTLKFALIGASLLTLGACASQAPVDVKTFAAAETQYRPLIEEARLIGAPYAEVEYPAVETLDAVVRYGLRHNPQMRAAMLGLAADALGPAQVAGAGEPRIGFGGEAGVDDRLPRGKGSVQAGLTASVEIWNPKRAHDFDRERYRSLSGAMTFQQRLQDTTKDIVLSYVLVLQSQRAVERMTGWIAALEKSARQAKERVEAKITTATEHDIALAKIEAVKKALLKERETLAQAANRYEYYVGHRPGKLVEPARLKAPASLAEALEKARQHPSRVIADAEIGAAIKQVESISAESDGQIGVTLRGLGVLLAAARGDLLNAGMLLVDANLPIKDEEARVRLERAQANAGMAVMLGLAADQRVRQAVSDAWASFQTAIADEKAAARRAAVLERVLTGTEQDWLGGQRSIAEVLNAVDEYHRNKVEEMRAAYTRLYAPYFLEATAGTLASTLGAVEMRTVTFDGRTDVYADITGKPLGHAVAKALDEAAPAAATAAKE